MTANPVKRYFWLIDTIHRHSPISFKEVAEKWEQSSIYDGKKLAIRTFHNHREAVEELFRIRIVCEEHTNKYYIAEQGELAKNGLSLWLLNAFSMNNILYESQSLGERVQVEDIPSAQRHLTELLVAMRENRRIKVTYHPFSVETPFDLVLQPLFVKLYERRWYLYANKPHEAKIKLYALDRMVDVEVESERFELPESFVPEAYTRNAFGVDIYDNIPPCSIRVRTCARLANYLRTLQLHSSQREVESTDSYADFEFFVAPTQEFYRCMLSFGSQVEVLSPESVRGEMEHRIMSTLVNYSNNDENE